MRRRKRRSFSGVASHAPDADPADEQYSTLLSSAGRLTQMPAQADKDASESASLFSSGDGKKAGAGELAVMLVVVG